VFQSFFSRDFIRFRADTRKDGKPIINPIIPIIKIGMANKVESNPVPITSIPIHPQLLISNPIQRNRIDSNRIKPPKNKPRVPKINLDSFSFLTIIN